MSIFENLKSAAKKEKPLMPVSLFLSAFFILVSAAQSPDYPRPVRLPQSQTAGGPGLDSVPLQALWWALPAGSLCRDRSPGSRFRKVW